MKPFTLLFLLFAAPVLFAQTSETELAGPTDHFKLPRFERTFGVAYETGGSFSFVESDLSRPPSNWEVATTRVNGCSVFYEQQVNRNGWGYSVGLGLGAMFAEYQLTFSNPEVLVFMEPDSSYTTINFKDNQSHNLTETAMPMMLDIPLNLSYAFRLKPQRFLRPYIGLRIRNIVYFAGQLSYQYQGRSLGTDSTYKGYVSIDYGTKWPPRVLGMANFGVKYSHVLNNGGILNGFVDYSLQVFNSMEVRLSNFNSKELVWKLNESTDQYEQVYYDFKLYQKGWPYQHIGLAFKMSTIRVGFSYSLPGRKENSPGTSL